MEWHQYSSIRATMNYIEKLLREIELAIEQPDNIYSLIENDLSKKQVEAIREEVNQMFIILEDAMNSFPMEKSSLTLSKIVDVNSLFILKTIEDSWSSKLEKKSGKTNMESEKEKLDRILKKLEEKVYKLQGIIKK